MSELTHAISSAESDEFIRLLAQGQLIDDRAEAAAEAPHEEDEGDDECAICQEIVQTPVKSPNAGCTHTYCASMCWLSATPPPMTQQHRESEKMNTNLKAEHADLKERIARQKKEIAQQEQGERELSEDFDELQRQEALTCVENADLKAEIARQKKEIARQRKLIARWEGWSKSQTITKKSAASAPTAAASALTRVAIIGQEIHQIAKEEDLFNPLGQAALCCAMSSS